MKNTLVALLLVTTMALAGLYVWQKSKATAAGRELAVLNQRLSEAQTQAVAQQERAEKLQARLMNTQAKAVAKADEVTHLQQVITNQTETNAKAGNPLSEMFKSPEMKELVKTQQKTVLSGMLDKTYGAYISGLQMTPEQSASLKDLLMKKSMVDANLGMSMLAGDVDTAKGKELAEQAKAEKDGIDQEIKQLLGDDNYAQFQSYEKTVPERMSLSLYKDAQGSGPGALSPEQEEQLVQAMVAERQNFKFTTDFNDQSKFNGDFSALLNEEKLNQFQTEQAQLDQQYIERAKQI
ncbi:MAG TPA: hypothetical protein VHI52_02340, partial [Verrucomicrobiae bacterium]|nr:hypothetical protein [Verrucomicrobiae bacterium]